MVSRTWWSRRGDSLGDAGAGRGRILRAGHLNNGQVVGLDHTAARKLDDELLLEDVLTDHLTRAVGGLHPRTAPRQIAAHLTILLVFIGKATKQATTDTGDLSRVERQILIFGHLNADAGIIGEKRGTAEDAPARADPAEELGLITRADLAQFDPALKGAGEIAHQYAEIHALIGGKVEGETRSIKAIFSLHQTHGQAMLTDLLCAARQHILVARLE